MGLITSVRDGQRAGERIVILAMCSLLMAFLFVAPATAQERNMAGLVVDYGDGRVSYAVVPFEDEQISGMELLKRSGLDVVSVEFGGLGDAVCQIDDTGCSVDDCRTRMCQTSDRESPFWQFSHLGDEDKWRFVSTGASGARVQDGDIYAWSWVGTEPNLPVLTMDELAERAGGYPSDAEPLQTSLRTEGGEIGDDGDTIDFGSVAAVGMVVLVAGVLVLRARRTSRPESVT